MLYPPMYGGVLWFIMFKDIYLKTYGCHFNEQLLHYALEEMENKDNTFGGHWSIHDTNDLAKQHDIEFNNYNEYDFCYVMNLMFSDYYKNTRDINDYLELTKDFLHDYDAPKGKAFKYFIAMHE